MTTFNIASTLKTIKEVFNLPSSNMEKGFKKLQNNSVEKIFSLIKRNLDKKHISAWMYRKMCLVKYSKDINIHNEIEKISNYHNDTFLYNFSRNKNTEMVNVDSFSDDSDTKRFVLFPYGGGKQNHKSTQQRIISNLLVNNTHHFKTYYEPFLGGFGSVYNSLPLLIKNRVQDIYLSDVNPSIINVYRQVQKNHKQVQRHLSSIDLEYLRRYGKLYPTTKEEGKEWFKEIYKEFNELEVKKRMNPKRAALFLYLLHNVQGGMINFNMKTKINSMSFCFCDKKLKQVPLIINKVEIFNKIFNLGNIKFSITRFETVNKKIKNDSTSLVLFDPPYVKYEEVSTSKDFLSCSYNYGINDFNHRGLINKIKDSKYSFVYYNNHNPHLENYSNRENFNYHKKNVIYTNGKEGTKSVEILMFKDRTKLSVNSVNSINFNPIEIKKVS